MMPFRRITACGPLLLTLPLVGCGDSVQAPPEGVFTVAVSASTDTLTFIGQAVPLTVTVRNSEGTIVQPAGVSWMSRNAAVLSVDPTGTVRAAGNGSTFVVAAVGSGADSVRLTVAQALATVTVAGADTVFTLGAHARLRATARDAGGQPYTLEPLVWSSDDPTVATVDDQGRVLPLAAGDATITVGTANVEATHVLTVEDLVPLQVDAALADSLQWALEDVSAANGVVGAQAAVIIPGAGTWVGAYGRSGESTVMRPDLAVPVGSVSKTIVSGLVLHLVDLGMVSLDDQVGTLLPPFANVTPSATVRQLLQNNSGIASFSSAPGYLDSLLANPGRVWTPAELVDRFIAAPVFEPGTSWKSSNSGYLLGGMIAEAVTGQTLAALYGSELYGPLSLDEIYLKGSEPPRAPTSEVWNGPAGGPLENITAISNSVSFSTGRWPLGGLVVSARTLAAWGAALFGNFLSPAVRAEMLTAVPDDGAIPGQVGAGLGVREFAFLGRTEWGHTGTAGDGSGMLLWDEGSGIVVALVYNQNGASHTSSHFVLAPRLLALGLAAP